MHISKEEHKIGISGEMETMENENEGQEPVDEQSTQEEEDERCINT